jgi:alkylation response protein AidB-like acyl-CoA dehydrogenase/GNAT superfamily N-acetyltransferase
VTVFDRFHDIGARLVRPSVATRDRDGTWDRALWREVCEAGLFRERGTAARAQAMLGLATGSLDLGFAVAACAQLTAIEAIERFGTPAQQVLANQLVDGSLLCAVANAEPQAGTDVMALRSRALPTDTGFTLTALKRNITNLGPADVALVSARLDGELENRAIQIFIVDCNAPRTWVKPSTELTGLRTSPTGALLCRGTPLPADAVLGPPGSGVAIFRTMFSYERLYTGQLYLAAIGACLARGLEHAETRLQFGAPLGKHQYVQGRIVNMRISEELLSAHLDRVTGQLESGAEAYGSLSIVKAFGVEAAIQSARDLIALLGQRGISREEVAERLLRDLLGLSILGGTVELQKMVIYSDAAKQRTKPAAQSATTLRVVETAALAEADIARLVALVARAFPDQPAIEGRWYYDSPPAFAILAERDGQLVGFRAVIERRIKLGDHELQIAGIGIAVDPDHQRTGVGRALTERLITELAARGCDLSIAFLFTPNAEPLLRRFEFAPLRARVSYLDRVSNAATVESMPCFARATPEVIAAVEAAGALDLGVGTW